MNEKCDFCEVNLRRWIDLDYCGLGNRGNNILPV